MTTATTHSSKHGNYSSVPTVPRMNYTSDASRNSLGTTGLGRSGSGDHIPSRPDRSFAIPLRTSDGGRQEAGMSQPTTLSSAIQTPMGGGWNTNYVSQQHRGSLARTDLKGGGGTTRVSPRVYSTILKHPQGSHQDRMDYNGIPGRSRPMGLCREAQKDQLAAKNAEAGWGSSGGRGGILPGLIGRMPGPPQSLMSFANSATNFGSSLSLDENSISATSHRRRSSSILPGSNPSLAEGDAKPYSELVTRSDKILSEVKKAIRPSLDENFNILGGSSAHTLVSTSPWDANPSDPGIKRQKNDEYRVYLQHQIEEKEKRLEAEKRETSKHPLGPSYESPSLPYHRQQVSILNTRLPNEAAILKKYIYDNPPHPTRRPSSANLPVPSIRNSSPNPMPFVKKEKQEEALRNLRQSRLKIYRNAESKDFPNNNYIIPDPHSKSHSPGHSSGSSVSSPPAPAGRSGGVTCVHTNSRRPAHQTHDNANVECQTTSQHHRRNDESPSGHLRSGYTQTSQTEVNNNWEGKDIAEGHNHHPDERDNFAQPHSTFPNPTNTGNQMHGTHRLSPPDLQFQQRQFNQPQYAHQHQQQPVQSQQHVSFYSPHNTQTYGQVTPYPGGYPLPGMLPQPQQYPMPPQMHPYPLPGPPCLPQATSPPAILPQMHTQPSFPQRAMQLARHEANPSEVQTHYRNRDMQEHSMVSFAEANDEGQQERRHRRVENDEDNEISEDVVRSIAEDLKRRTINKQKIWQTSDELPDREVLTVLHKTELKQQIAEKQRQRDEQRRRENAEDAKLDRKIQEYHDELRRRDEEKKYQFQVMRLLEADKKPSVVQIVEPSRNTRRVRVYESDTNLTRPKPSTPPIERYDPEITLAAKLKPGKGHGQAGSTRRGVNNKDGSLPSLGNAFIHPVKSRVISPPVPAVYKKIASGRRLNEEDSYNSKSRNDHPSPDEGGSVFFQQLQDYMRRERADVERSLRQRLDEEDTRRIKKSPS